MSNFKFELNREGVRELMKSREMQEIVKAKADAVQRRAGEGYVSDVQTGRNRAVAQVKAETVRAKRSNRKHNTLLKALYQ